MMTTIDTWLVALALAMDCFTVSITCGIIEGRRIWRGILTMAFLFGFFQAMMPLLGWTGIRFLAGYLESFDHWIAFGLLSILGVRMIHESYLPPESKHLNPLSWKTQIIFAFATSIDALAVGISFSCMGYRTIGSLAYPLVVIGIVSFMMAVIGNLLGIRYGEQVSKRLKPELLGGIILIFIGVKVLLSHLLGL